MKERELEKAIYERYIVPTKRQKTEAVGLEFELPVVNRNNSPVDFSVVHKITDNFVEKFGFSNIQRDTRGYIYSAVNPDTGDGLSYDCSYNTLEFSFGTERNMHVLYRRFVRYYTFLQEKLRENGHTLTGMGINPHHTINRNVPVDSERYKMLLHHLTSYTKYGRQIPFHDCPNFGLFSCASQIQLDVEEQDLVEVLNTFTRLEPLKALLFANSPWGEEQEVLCSRDNFWRNSLHGLNRHNVDMFETEFASVEEIVYYIESMSLYCVERDGKYINFPPTPLRDYFSSESIAGEYFDGGEYRSIRFCPQREDLKYLRSFKFEDLTFRGTVEFRSVCEQPVKEIMASGAFHAGLMEKLHDLTELLQNDQVIYHRGYNASELRRMFVKRDLPQEFDWKAVSKLLTDILDIAADGLRQRGFSEEKFLEPLYRRADLLLSPAREMLQGLADGKISHSVHPFPGDEHIVRDFCENQTEINTSVHFGIDDAVRELEYHQQRICDGLQKLPRKEYLWLFSNPAYIENEKDIPVAVFSGSSASKTAYREYLSDKYGRYKMTFSGIHVNFSFTEDVLRADFALQGGEDFIAYKDSVYLDLAKKMTSYGWILVAVTAASPLLDSSFVEKGVYGRDVFNGMASVRCSEMGYWNHFTPVLQYQSAAAYADSIKRYVDKGFLTAPSELYYPIRLKPRGENRLDALRKNGIDHIELRMFDLNPLTEAGVEKKDIAFAQLLMIWLAAMDEMPFPEKDQVQAVQNFKNAARYDLKTVKIQSPEGKIDSVANAAMTVIDQMKIFYQELELPVQDILQFEYDKFTDAENRYAWKIREQFGQGYVKKALALARERQDR